MFEIYFGDKNIVTNPLHLFYHVPSKKNDFEKFKIKKLNFRLKDYSSGKIINIL